MSESVERALHAAFPKRSIRSIEKQNTRPGNETAFVTFSDGDTCYVKTATDYSTRLVRETAATRYAGAQCPVGVPRVIAADTTGDVPYLVTEPLSGTVFNEPWTEGVDRELLLERVGRAIAGVHEAQFERSGVIIGGGTDTLDLRGGTWTETLCETIEWRADDWFADRFSDLPKRLVETIRDWNPTLDASTPTLLHGDPSRINVHLDPNGLLDWERAVVGDPAFGLVETAFHHLDQPDVDESERPALRSALHDGYRERAGELPDGLDRRRPLYEAVSHLLVAQTFDEWAPEVDQPTDELATNVREEFGSRLADARNAM